MSAADSNPRIGVIGIRRIAAYCLFSIRANGEQATLRAFDHVDYPHRGAIVGARDGKHGNVPMATIDAMDRGREQQLASERSPEKIDQSLNHAFHTLDRVNVRTIDRN